MTNIASTVLHDYCSLIPDAVSVLKCLPQLSAHFTCNFITAVAALHTPYGAYIFLGRFIVKTRIYTISCLLSAFALYTFWYIGLGGKAKRPLRTDIVEVVAEWLVKDSHLCLISLDQSHSTYIQPQRSSLWTSPTKPNMQTPVPGLVRWCTQAPIAQAISTKMSRNEDDNAFANNSTEQNHKTEQLWSRLHLSVLQTVMDFPNLPGANQLELITLADMNRIVKDIVTLIREAKNKNITDEPYGIESIEVSVDRVVQILQVSLATGAFRCSLGKNTLPIFLVMILMRYGRF